jgi:vacuole morphology and inheritance protein 14
MADSTSLLSASVLRNLADKLYEKRKIAALEVEGTVRGLVSVQDHDKISNLISLLTFDYALSPQANHRKVGCHVLGFSGMCNVESMSTKEIYLII